MSEQQEIRFEIGKDGDEWFVRHEGVEYRFADRLDAIAMVAELAREAMSE